MHLLLQDEHVLLLLLPLEEGQEVFYLLIKVVNHIIKLVLLRVLVLCVLIDLLVHLIKGGFNILKVFLILLLLF